jgi:hypothetical protein
MLRHGDMRGRRLINSMSRQLTHERAHIPRRAEPQRRSNSLFHAYEQLDDEISTARRTAASHFESVRALLQKRSADLSIVDAASNEFEKRLIVVHRHRLASLNNSVNEVKAWLLASGLELQQATNLEADYHDGARPLLVTDSRGCKYVYKRSSCFPYRLYNYWLGDIANHPTFSIVEIDGERRAAIRPYVNANTTVTNPKSYFFECGRLLGFAMLFNVVDLHCENIVIAENVPLPVDLECTFHLFPNLTSSFNLEYTGLVERNVAGRKRHLSALYGGGSVAEWCDPYIDESGRVSALRIINIVTNRPFDEARCIFDVSLYGGYILEGFNEFLHCALRRYYDVYYWIELGESVSHRRLYCPSILYRMLLSEGSFVGLHGAKQFFRRRLRQYRSFRVDPEVFDSELAQLVRGDTPIFHSNDDKTAYHWTGALLRLRRIEILRQRGVEFLSAQLAALLNSHGR